MAGLFADRMNQCGGDAAAAGSFGGEEILQIAHGGDRDGAAVVQEMDKAEELAVACGDQRVMGSAGSKKRDQVERVMSMGSAVGPRRP